MKRIYILGMGPGDRKYLSIEASEILAGCQVIVGYTVYVELLKADYPEKLFLATPMKGEIRRCRMAFEKAQEGLETVMVCSGDAGVYGMAGLLYEMSAEYPEVELTVIPGITAALAGAAVLGAPLMHDFAIISLSDLLTPWGKIEKRLVAAAMADFVICLYNPSSRKRSDYLQKACDLILQYKEPGTVCGIARNIGREEEQSEICFLEELRNKKVDMFTTIYIGNQETKAVDGKMVTPRGYPGV